ncbi:TRAF3-interacting protein 1 [Chanos chanos]|uniref:TRAF3-interacting protein 1 n=1 Tax=Chanos chanos TaxID=29144 RepID=A0A6J2WGP1_CHACN|nr:TRAF3-interacting protein 1 [Chanos chanos]
MNGTVVKKTQDTLGKVIKKPPLTEKLLSKPPFRYLHDIFSEVIRTTGFMKGLYGDAELKSENVKDKDSKIAFLQKAIDVVMLVSGEPLSAKPARIVAGHEPEKTNELLQAIAKCCLNKLSSDEAVRRVLAGDKVELKGKASTSKSQDKENREVRLEKREIKESSAGQDQKESGQARDQEARRREKDRHRDGERVEKRQDRDRTKDRDQDKEKSRDRDKDKSQEKDREREKDKKRDRDRERDRERDGDKDREKNRERNREKDHDHEKRREREKDREKERERHREEKVKERGDGKLKGTEESSKQKTHAEAPSKNHKPETEHVSPVRIPRPSSAKGQRRQPKPGGQGTQSDESDSDAEGKTATTEKPVHLENGEVVPHQTANRRAPRPGSARPAPPRVKRQESYTDVTSAERQGSAKAPSAVIVEGKKDEEEDGDDLFVVEESAVPEMEVRRAAGPSIELQGDEKHGGLVTKILATKKDFESTPSSPKSKDQDWLLESKTALKKEREMVIREIEHLRSGIQTVCSSALPMGKIMDYIQEDVDAMQKELQTWRKENEEHAQALLQEQRITESTVEPLKAQLSELEQLIKEEQDKICALKGNIWRNEQKIQKMLSSINSNSYT